MLLAHCGSAGLLPSRPETDMPENTNIAAFEVGAVDSTNLEAKRLLEAGRISGPAYILAREQTAGRGSHGRSWVSPRDAGIYLSIVDVPTAPTLPDLTLFTLAAGVACAAVLRDTTGVDVRLKPVNDLYADGRKLGGILTETVVERGVAVFVITGIGINVRSANRPVGPDTAEPVALQSLMPAYEFAHIDPCSIVRKLCREVLRLNRTVWAGDENTVRRAWNNFRIEGCAPLSCKEHGKN
jgi:biotin-(acetyl-CoA carboxylase) ligase